MARFLALTCVISSLLVTACGGSGASGEDGPASLAPPDAPLYLEAVVRPEGDLREDALAAFGRVSGAADPAAEVRRLFDEATDGEVDYDADIEPWLGERIGVWGDRLDGDDAGFAAIVATTDADAALQTLERAAEDEGTELTDRSHAGTDYRYSAEEDQAAAAVGDFLVVGTEPEVKRTIEVADGDSLAEADRYRDAVDRLEEERLATFYLDQRALLGAAAASGGGQEAQIFRSLFDTDALQPVAGGLLADGERIAIEMAGSTAHSKLAGGLSALGGEAGSVLGELPGDAWVAFGIPDLGATVRELYTTFAGALGGAAIEGQLREQTGLDLQNDVFGWIGDVGVYAAGTGPEGLGGALVIEITDAGKATAAFGKIAGLLRTQASADVSAVEIEGAESAFEIVDREVPRPIVLARGSERVVVAFGREAATAALSPSESLGDSDLWERAKAALDDEFDPSFVLDMGAVLENVDAFGGGEDPDFRQARPYLQAIDVITAGGEVDGDEQLGRLAVGLDAR